MNSGPSQGNNPQRLADEVHYEPVRKTVGINHGKWLPDMDLNHDKQIQSLLCYRYTIGQTRSDKVESQTVESRLVRREMTSNKQPAPVVHTFINPLRN